MRIVYFLVLLFCFISCKKEPKRFELIGAKDSGIDFENTITEQDTLNILDTEFVYNGGGVTVGDLNGDGLQDIYFCGNQVQNKLYLNTGDMKFKDVTAVSKTQKRVNQWSSGVSFIDINNDQKLDIYVNNTMSPSPEKRQNLLFVNQGNNKENTPVFKELAAEYGLNDDSNSSSAAFFDFDNDGDLDVFVAVNFIDQVFPNQYLTRTTDGSAPTRDRLYKNEFDAKLGHAVFEDISLSAGIVHAGYSHSVLTHDFNEDGWQDIYIANDYLTNDLIYINNKNGTFTNRVADIFKHQSNSAMGSDVADIDNDGKMDFVAMEMLPFDAKRKKLMQGANNYTSYLYNKEYKYEYQYVHNTLQLNRGISPETGLPVFSDIAFMANVEATDWSWTPLLADFDNDGHRDLLVTNGFPKDVTDNDFGAFRTSISSTLTSVKDMNDMMPEIKTPNFIFKNNGDYTFSDKSADWGIDIKSFTNGTAYADFDNDGDLDIVTNNIDDKAFLFKNNTITKKSKSDSTNYLRIQLVGNQLNTLGISSKITAYFGRNKRVAEVLSTRGYLSNSEEIVHFGLGKIKKIDSVIVHWNDGKFQKIINPEINTSTKINYKPNYILNPAKKEEPLLTGINPDEIGLGYEFFENDFIDFNLQKTLPHKTSQNGPGIAVGDINGDGLDDIVAGGSSRFEGHYFIQKKDGKFTEKTFNLKTTTYKKEEDLGVLLFDADNDGDNDIYFVRGSYQHEINSEFYKDILCVNDGKGNFKVIENAIPKITANGQTVKAVDFDNDGDLDLFVGGKILPKAYPKADQSYLLRNDTKTKDNPIFVDATMQICPEIANIGMISDALFTDFDNDNKTDLILAGEWMPITFLKNTGKKFLNITKDSGIENQIGWWNSLAAVDIDNDGDMDYVAGNYGKNLYFKCNSGEPITIYAKDFDGNGSYDPFISCYFRDSTGRKNEYFYHSKDDMQKQLILIRKKFERYSDFGKASVKDVFTKEEMEGVQIIKANCFESSILINEGNGKFIMKNLPKKAQFAPIFGISTTDLNHDGFQDLLLTGNDFGMEIFQGRADAFYGLVLMNNKKGGFETLENQESGFYVPGDARALAKINIQNRPVFLATQNNSKMKIFKMNGNQIEKLKKDEVYSIVTMASGKKAKFEFAFGNTFISQNGRFVEFDKNFKKIDFYNQSGKLTRSFEPK